MNRTTVETETGPDDFFPVEEDIQPAASATLYANEPIVEKGNLHLQFKGRFILTSVKSGLMLIDQHRAHVRVLFDRYMLQIKQKQGMSQGVLFPEILQLPASEAAVLQLCAYSSSRRLLLCKALFRADPFFLLLAL